MSLSIQPLPAIPALTVEVARAAFPEGNRYMKMRDELGTFYRDEDYRDCYGIRGQPGIAPWRLSLISLFQFVEGLSDEQAVQAVASRIDWKYALSLDLKVSGFDASVLSEFRGRVIEHDGTAPAGSAIAQPGPCRACPGGLTSIRSSRRSNQPSCPMFRHWR